MFEHIKFYNFICSADENQWEKSPSTFPKYRLFEYTRDSVLSDVITEDGTILTDISNKPTLFVNEDIVGKVARVGQIKSTVDHASDIVIDFEFYDDFLPIPNYELSDLMF